jgi:RNA polymerase sigma factor (sigma-70 family)
MTSNKDVKYSFEEISHILYKQAHKVKRMFPNKYELDELVNEVWIKGNIQKLSSVKFVAKRAYWDMVDYLRQIEGRQIMRKDVKYPRPSFRTNMHDISIKYNSEGGVDMFENIENRDHVSINLVDNRDEIKHLLKCLPQRDFKLLTDFFINEMRLKDVGKSLGICEAAACQAKGRAIKEIRTMHDIVVVDKKKKKKSNNDVPLVNVLPEYVSDYEIDNEHSFNEDFVLERDWDE